MIIEHADLHCTEGSADKVYHLGLDTGPAGWSVDFAYGRRGSTLKYGTKTASGPTTEVRARSIYQKQLTIQYSKGYRSSPGISGNIFGVGLGHTATANGITAPKELTNHRPQLLNVIEEKDLEFYFASEEWGAQEKMDGVRLALEANSDGLRGINRKGQPVLVMEELRQDWKKHMQRFLVDGEGIGDKIYAFDILQHEDECLRGLPYIDRYLKLSRLIDTSKPDNMILVPLHTTEIGKRRLYERLRAEGAEGIVFKRLDARFTEGRPNLGGDQVKFKFWDSATCYVTEINDKRSVKLKVWAGIDTGGLNVTGIDIGNVTIPANHDIPDVGDIVEIRYLYCYPGGKLFQPQYEGRRTDMTTMDCTYSQLKMKQKAL